MQENPGVLNDQAVRLAGQGLYIEAITCFRRAITVEKDNYILWYNLGVTYKDSGKLTLAKEAFKAALEIVPEDTSVLEALGEVCFKLEQYQEAIDYCIKGVELDSNSIHIWNTLGVIYFNIGDYANACAAFESAVSIDPNYKDALYNLCDTYKSMGNTTGYKECQRRLSSLC